MSFLTAEWRKLAMVNYVVEPKRLTAYLPHGTELDLWQGRCYVSLVGFMFLDTRLMGVPIPFHRNFEEVNLRFYVRHKDSEGWKRGVVFIKEIVPKPALTWVANTLYKEHYQTMPMQHQWKKSAENWEVTYQWKHRQQWQKMKVVAENTPVEIPKGSEEEFITEHYWGYSRVSKEKTYEYEVKHPRWQHYPVKSHLAKVDFERVYGAKFAFLNGQQAHSALLAEGSEISVENKRAL